MRWPSLTNKVSGEIRVSHQGGSVMILLYPRRALDTIVSNKGNDGLLKYSTVTQRPASTMSALDEPENISELNVHNN